MYIILICKMFLLNYQNSAEFSNFLRKPFFSENNITVFTNLFYIIMFLFDSLIKWLYIRPKLCNIYTISDLFSSKTAMGRSFK